MKNILAKINIFNKSYYEQTIKNVLLNNQKLLKIITELYTNK